MNGENNNKTAMLAIMTMVLFDNNSNNNDNNCIITTMLFYSTDITDKNIYIHLNTVYSKCVVSIKLQEHNDKV